MSLATLAEHAFYTKGYLSKVENGLKEPSRALAGRCDAVLDAGGRLAELVPLERLPDARADPLPGGDPFALAAPGADPNPSAAAAAAADEHSLPTLIDALEQCRRLGHQFSPRPVLESVRGLTGWVRILADHAEDPVAAVRFGLLAARYAEYAGWMAQEAGDDQLAANWTRLAVTWARAAGDDELPWLALIRDADIALYRYDPARMIEVSRLAQEAAPVRVRSLAAQREAQGFALLGDYDSCLRALDRSAELGAQADRADRADRNDWPAVAQGTSVADRLAITRGWALVDLGRPAEAASVLDDEVPRISPIAVRSRARYGLRQALAHLGAGHLDRACELLNSLITDVVRADSATIRLDLRRVVQELSRWRTHPLAADLVVRLSAVLRTP
jgi:hypothetical protein